jgi:hypothetical protein
MLPVALLLWPTRLASCRAGFPVCERSVGPHLHPSFAASMMVDRFQSLYGIELRMFSCISNVCFIWYCMCFNWTLHMLHWLYTNVASVCFKCFIYFRRMLQAFYRYVSYVATIHVCCKCMFQMFHLLQTYCKCFIRMLHTLQWLYTYVATVCLKYFTCFRLMLQQVLHFASIFISRRGIFHAF